MADRRPTEAWLRHRRTKIGSDRDLINQAKFMFLQFQGQIRTLREAAQTDALIEACDELLYVRDKDDRRHEDRFRSSLSDKFYDLWGDSFGPAEAQLDDPEDEHEAA